MTEPAPAYVSDSAPPRPTGCRMRQTTWVAANRVRMMTRLDGVSLDDALKSAGISNRSYQRFLAAIEGGPRRLTEHVEAPTAKCLPLFQTDPDVLRRLSEAERRLAEIELAFDGRWKALRAAAGYLADAANELADWPNN